MFGQLSNVLGDHGPGTETSLKAAKVHGQDRVWRFYVIDLKDTSHTLQRGCNHEFMMTVAFPVC